MSKLFELRKACNFSYQQMANKLNISKTFYWQIENEQRRLSYDMAYRIAQIFNLKPDEIFFEEYKKRLEAKD